MKKSRVAAATSAGFLGLIVVAAPASAEITSVTLSTTEPGNDIGMTVTGTGCLPDAGDVVRVRVAPVDGEDFVNGVVGIPDDEGNWEAVGSVDITEAGDYDVRAFCHFDGTDPQPTDVIGSAQITLSDPDPDPDPPDPGPGDPPPGGPGEEPPGGPGEPGTEPGSEEPGDDDGNGDGEGDDGDAGTGAGAGAGGEAGSTGTTAGGPSAQPAGAPAAVNGSPDLTG